MGLRLSKYIELRENWAAENNYSGPSANIPLDESIIGREVGGAIAQRGRSLISTIAFFLLLLLLLLLLLFLWTQ